MNKLLILSALIMSGCSAPDYYKVTAGLSQHERISDLCVGSGMTKHLISSLSAGGVWELTDSFKVETSIEENYCMFNEKSNTDTVYESRIIYEFGK